MSQPDQPWSVPVRLSEVGRGPEARRLEPDEAARARIARHLDLVALPAFEAEVRLVPWHDGVELQGRWRARVTYRCGVTVEPFDDELSGEFTVRAVPAGSPLAGQAAEPGQEVELDLEAEDPPDVLESEAIDLGAYLVEHLGLELDPFPRKPGAVFEAPAPETPESPFAVLRRLKPDPG
jgi:hypothetical protein